MDLGSPFNRSSGYGGGLIVVEVTRTHEDRHRGQGRESFFSGLRVEGNLFRQPDRRSHVFSLSLPRPLRSTHANDMEISMDTGCLR